MEFYIEPRSHCRTCDYSWRLIQNQWETVKSPFKMVHWTVICDYGWFKTSEREAVFDALLAILLLSLFLLYHLLFIVITIIVYCSQYYCYNNNYYYYHSWYLLPAHLHNYNKRMSSLKERILGDKYRLLLPLIVYCYHCHYLLIFIIITFVYNYNYYYSY